MGKLALPSAVFVVLLLLLMMFVDISEETSVGYLQVRLVGGANIREGRVEVRRYSNESWGTICDDIWTDTTAMVVCKQLGLGEWGEARKHATFGEGTGSIWLDSVSCVGTESNLGHCSSAPWGSHDCGHHEDAGVVCHQYLARLKAQYGSYNSASYGSVEFISGTSWVAVCDSDWNDTDAKVTCRMLGYEDGAALCCSRLSPYTHSRYLPSARNMNCTGTEHSLANCSFSFSTTNCPSNHLASAVCYKTPKAQVEMSFSVRLVNGSSSWGRVEVRYMGAWGVVCVGSSWNDTAATVVCKQLGFTGGVKFGGPLVTQFDGSGWVTSLNCTGRETSLEQCVVQPIGTPSYSCRPAYALCYTTAAPTVQLVGGGASYGRVEVSVDGGVYTVCDNNWSEYDATAVCRSLGFQGGDPILRSYYGPGSGQVALDSVSCGYSDTNLLACKSKGWLQTETSCSDHTKDAGVTCFGAVRLKKGDHAHGVLTVKVGRWYYAVCGTGFDDTDASVACGQLGFERGIALPTGSYGMYQDAYKWRNLNCTGNESSIFQCRHDSGSCVRNSFTNYASVYCFNGTIASASSLSLEGGQGPVSNSSGRLVVRLSGVQGKVCPAYWDDLDARVACRQLEYHDGLALAFSGARSGPYLLNDVACTGVETSIFSCLGNETCSLPYSNPPDAGVLCFNDSAPVLQLIGGASGSEGVVQVVYGGQAGTVCSSTSRRTFNARVVCRQLGYVDGTYKPFPRGAVSVLLNEVGCYGYESSIFMCRNQGFFSPPSDTCANHNNDLGVQCFDSVRLTSITQTTNDTIAGVVQMYYGSEWRYVCPDFFDNLEAEVICRKLGYGNYRALPKGALGRMYFNPYATVTGLNCTGSEESLTKCPFQVGTCPGSQTNYASVFCSKTSVPQGLRPLEPQSQPGSVMFLVDGLASFVCPDGWDDTGAVLYCKALGYSYGTAMTPTYSGSPLTAAARLIANINCTGREVSVGDCSFSTDPSSCTSFIRSVAGVFCYNNQQDLQIRLTGGSIRYEGRVEVAINGVWGPVCDFGFTENDAAVTCRSLGFLGGVVVTAPTSGTTSTRYYFLNVRCTGSEAKLWHCPFYSVNVSNSYCVTNTAAVKCTGEVRVHPGVDYGALAVLVNRTSSSYGLVCDENFTDREASVACRDLGYPYGIHLCCSAFDVLSLPIVRTAVRCTGTEALFSDCSYSTSLTYCPSGKYASVVCSNTPAGTGYRVEVGTVQNRPYGLVKVQHMGHWGYVCPNGFDNNDASVICREAGYTGGVAFDYSTYRSDLFTAIRWLSNIDCRGTESHLSRCNNIIWGNISDCYSYGDAAVICYQNTAPQFRLVNGTRTMGRLEVWGDEGIGGRVCGHLWTELEADVACKGLGFNSGRFLGAGAFGQGDGQVFIDYVDCFDAVAPRSLLDCYIWLYGLHDYSLCSNQDGDAAVQCFDRVRLTGSKQTTYGRVEVYISNNWTAVCDQGFDQTAAQVACRSLGFLYGRPQCCSALGPLGTGSVDARQIGFKINRCRGDEATLTDCDFSTSVSCPSGRYASLLCSNTSIQELPLTVRLAGPGSYYGTVEVNRYGLWGPVCNSNWDDRDANATCHGLGYGYGVAFYGSDVTGSPMLVGEFRCTGLESSLASCAFKDIDDDVGCSETPSRRSVRVTAGVLCYDTPGMRLQLVDGGTNYGRLEVLFEGERGRVADYDFTNADADVACRQLGFGGGRKAPDSMTKASSGKIWMNYVSCRGHERSLFECYSRWNYKGYYSQDANIICYNTTRLTDGNQLSYGRVEININNRWGPICDHGWTATDTGVACRDLGYESGYHLCCEPFGYGVFPIADNVQCSGTEAALSSCTHSIPDNSFFCTRNTVSLACYRGPAPTDYTYRLNGGPANNSGEVQVTFMNITGRICSDNWDDTDARVFCRELGFQTGKAFKHFTYNSFGPFWVADVNCQGTEMSLADCRKSLGGVSHCNSGHSAGVTCLDSEGIYYRLGGSDSGYKGRVEVAVNGVWGTACGLFFDSREATVFCRTLGYSEGQADYSSSSYPDPPTTIYQASFLCTGNEDLLENCPHQGWRVATSSYCQHTDDAKVFCFNDVRIGGSYDPSSRQGPVQFYNNGTWYNLCDTGFDDVTARRVCQDLGYIDGKAVCCSAYGTTIYYIRTYQTSPNYTMQCRGTERDASECLKSGGCLSANYASVVCFNNTDFPDESYRFNFDNASKTSGQVIVTHLGMAGRICNTFWDDADARVLCRSRGHQDGAAYHYSQYNYQSLASRGPYWLSDINCTGSEASLGDCPFNDRLHLGNCSTADLAGAVCFNGTGIQYRIVDGELPGSGRVELSVGGLWGTICDWNWDDKDASVLCRTLNYTDGYAVGGAHYGQGTGPVWLSSLRCKGSERSLAECPHSGFDSSGSYGCSHSSDASVVCNDKLKLNLGLDASMGAVLVYSQNAWTLICDTGFDGSDAMVVCRSFGFAHGTYVTGGVFGSVRAQIGITNVRCTGREKSFQSCPHDVSTSCRTGAYASVYCSEDPIIESDVKVRITEDIEGDPSHGRIDVQVEGVWGAVCAAGFGVTEATVACRELGFAGGVPYTAHLHDITKPILMSDVKCRGDEKTLINCQYTTTSTTSWCDYYAPRAGVLCYNDTTGIHYRLAGDSDPTRGRVEMQYGGQWGIICTWYGNYPTAAVACRSVGYQDGLPISSLRYSTSLKSWFFQVDCQGNESSIPECHTSGFNDSFGYYYDYFCRQYYTFSVQCYSQKLALTGLRLAGGSTNSSGRVEVFLQGPNQWGTVCDDSWDDVDATVVCRQLGYATGKAVMQAGFGQGSGKIWMDHIDCKGTETKLQDCTSSGFGEHHCSHDEDAGVICSGVYTPSASVSPTSAQPPTGSTPPPLTVTPRKPSTAKPDKQTTVKAERLIASTSSTAAIAAPVVVLVVAIVVVAIALLYRRRQGQKNDSRLIPEGGGPGAVGGVSFLKGGAVRFVNNVRERLRRPGGEQIKLGIANPGYDSATSAGLSNPVYDITLPVKDSNEESSTA